MSSISAVPDLSSSYQPTNTQGNFRKVRSEFDQLGQDLKSGNLSQAQADFATLKKDLPQGPQSATSPLGQDFSALSQALQSGNVASAQQAFTTLQTDLQSAAQTHHHHHHGGSQEASSTTSQDFTQLGADLQSGDLAAAQKAFSTLQNDLQKYRLNAQGSSGSNSAAATPSINVNG
jgi:outer membrane protein assembly factor BamD (BamD/ComL family)